MTLYGDQKGLEFFEASAKENINVKNVFDRLVDIICDKMSDNIDNNPGAVGGTSKGEFWGKIHVYNN